MRALARRRRRLATLALAGGLLLALSLVTFGRQGWWHGRAESAWLGPAAPGPEPDTWRLEARLGSDRADVYLPETTTTRHLPVALIRGSRDGASTAADVPATWQQLRTPRRALLTLHGVNHDAITNSSRPINPPDLPAAHPDPNAATADQRATLEQIARWSGRFLREAAGDSATTP